MRNKPFQAVYPNLDYITSVDAVCEDLRFDDLEYRDIGFFKKTVKESLFVLEITRGTKMYTGLVASGDIRDYSEGRIKRHEDTLVATGQQQIHLMIRRIAIQKPNLVSYEDIDEVNAILNKQKITDQLLAEVKFDKSGEIHKLWRIMDGNTGSQIQSFFLDKVPSTYIADGHHCHSSSAILEERKKIDELNIK